MAKTIIVDHHKKTGEITLTCNEYSVVRLHQKN